MLSTLQGRLLYAVPLLLLVGAVTACPGQTTIHSFSQSLKLTPIPGGTYSGFTGTTFSPSLPDGSKILIQKASISSSSGEFSWIDSLEGTAPSGADAGGGELLISKESFAGVGASTPLTIDDTGDISPLYPSRDTIRVYWAIVFAAAPAQAYPDGLTLTFDYTIQIE